MRDGAAIAAGFIVLLVVAGVDIAAGRHTVVVGAIVVAPLLTMVLGSARATAIVAVAAFVAAVICGSWDHDFATWPFVLRSVAVGTGGGLAVVAVRAHERSELSAWRFGLLMRLAQVGESGQPLRDTVAALSEVLVPDVCDLCIVDLVRGGAPERLGVRASGARAPEIEAFLLRRGPEPVTASVSFTAEVARRGAVLIDHITDEMIEGWSHDERDLAELRSLELCSTLILPLRSGDRLAGVLTLSQRVTSGRRFGADELGFVTVLAGRVGLALDNAGLTQQLTETERRMASSLENLVEAVIVQDPSGTVTFANAAALELTGMGNRSAVRVEELLSHLAFFDEDGTPVSLARLPAGRMLAGASPAPMLLRARSDDVSEERWLLAKCSAVRDERGQLTGLVSIFEDVTAVERVEQARRLLSEATEVLASSLDYTDTLGRVAALATRSLADWCTVSLPDRDGTLRRVALATREGDAAEVIRATLARIPPGATTDAGDTLVMREGRAQMVNDLTEETLRRDVSDPALRAALGELDLGAVIIVPLLTVGASIGVMTLCRTRGTGRFVEADLALAEELGRRAGTAIENARLYSERTRIATMLQQALRPPTLEAPDGWTVAAMYEPAGEASEAGGDFYDLFPVPGGHIALIGDVTGHGPDAARLTSLARYTLRTAAELTGDPLRSMQQLNAALRSGNELLLATALCVHLTDAPNGQARATVVAAGHPLPLILSPTGLRSAGTPGLIAGVNPDPAWSAVETELSPGETLVLYTDGVTDTRRGPERFGETRLADCLASTSGLPDEVITQMQSSLGAFRSRPADDDVALIALRYDGGSAADAGAAA